MMAQSSATLMLVRFFHGTGSALVVPIAMAIGAEVAPRGHEGAFLGTLQTSLFLGIGSGPLLSGLLTDHLGWNSSFFAMAAMTTLALIMVIVKLPSASTPKSSATKHQKQGNPFPILFHMIKDRTLKPVLVFQFCSAMARGSLLMLVPLLAADMDLSFFRIGIVVSANSLATAVCQRLFGKISDRKGQVPFVICGGLISSLVFFSLPFSESFLSLTILSTLFGFGRSASSPALTAIAALRGKLFGVGRTMGIYNMAFSMGMMAGPVLGGIITEFAGTDPAFLTMGIFLALSLLPFTVNISYSEVEAHSTE
jgi:MFS family permease